MPQTGPTTRRGKAIASRNSFKHGIASVSAVIEDRKDRKEWVGIRDGVIESLNPANTTERLHCERIALALWKLRCYERWQSRQIAMNIAAVDRKHREEVQINAELLAEGHSPGGRTEYDADYVDFAQKFKLVPSAREMDLIMRYEAHYHRQYIQALRELEAMQTYRKGGSSPLARLPAVEGFDVIGAPGG
ncbi:MAG: hypothetical protein WD904_04590 [Dehalococcoidia bacterium]